MGPTQLDRATRWILIAVLVVAAGLRIAWCSYATGVPIVGDPVTYYLQGVQIAEGKGYNNANDLWRRIAEMSATGATSLPGRDIPTAIGPPGYPAVLGALFWLVLHLPIADNFVAAAVSLNIALSTATVLMVFAIVRRLFDARTGLVAAALLAVYPNLIFHTATLHWETTFIFVIVAALLLLVFAPWSGGRVPPRSLLVFAALLGLSVLIRPIAVPIVLVLFLVARLEGASFRTAIAQSAIVVGVIVAMVLPWTIRNIIKLHAPVVISTGYGAALCMSRHPDARGDRDRRNADRAMHRYCLPKTDDVPIDEREVRENEYAAARAIEFVREHPLQELRLWPSRLRYAYRSDHDALDDAAPHLPARLPRTLGTIADWFSFAVLGLAAAGAHTFVRRGASRRLLIALTAVVLAATPIILYGQPRYKVPAMPLLTMMAAAGLVALLDRVTNIRPRARPVVRQR